MVINNVLSIKDVKHIHAASGNSYPSGRILKVQPLLSVHHFVIWCGPPQLTKVWLKPTRKAKFRETKCPSLPRTGEVPRTCKFHC